MRPGSVLSVQCGVIAADQSVSDHGADGSRRTDEVLRRGEVVVFGMQVRGGMPEEHAALIRINTCAAHRWGCGVAQTFEHQATVVADDVVDALVKAFAEGAAVLTIHVGVQM